MNLRDRRVLITGASRGIGRGLAEGCARRGARLALVARSEGPLQQLAERLGGRAYAVDLARPGGTDGLIERIEDDGGPIDVLVNNAGASHIKYMLDNTPEEIDAIFRLNTLAPIHLCHQVIPRMLERGGGHIVNLSSLAAVIVPPGLVHYSATKAALSHYTAGLRQDLRGLPIGTTLVQIGSVPTEMDDMTREYEPMKRLLRRARSQNRVPVETVVNAILDAVEGNRRHVRLPRSIAPLCALVEIPRRLMELAFRNIETRPQ